MPNFSNFDVYKVTSPTINGYLFSVTENTEEVATKTTEETTEETAENK